jgi:hypothetical protein
MMNKLENYETLYRKVGRKYEAIGTARDIHFRYENLLYAGQWRLEYCPKEGRGRYWYDVTPDIASWSAAAMMAEHSMIEAIDSARFAVPKFGEGVPLTKAQQKAVAQANKLMKEVGLLDPLWWSQRSAYDIAKAGIDAVREFGK